MMSKFRKCVALTLFGLTSFTITNVASIPSAHAAVGLAVWPLIPLAFVGAAFEGAAVAHGGLAIHYKRHGFRSEARFYGFLSLAELLFGILLLDEESQTTKVEQLSTELGTKFGLTENERIAYNEAVEAGEIEAILQDATSKLNKDSSQEEAGSIMAPLLAELSTDAHKAFNKIATHLVSQ